MNAKIGYMLVVCIIALGCGNKVTNGGDDEPTASAITTPGLTITDAVATPGTGRNETGEAMTSKCIKNEKTVFSTGRSGASSTFNSKMTSEDLAASFNYSVSAKADLKFASGSSQTKIGLYYVNSSTSMSVMYQTRIVLGTEKFDPSQGYTIDAKNPLDLQERCGNYFVDEVVKGGDLFIVIKISFNSTQVKATFEQNYSSSIVGLGSASATIKAEASALLKNANIFVYAEQHGGIVGNLTSFLGGKETAECGGGNIDQCINLISRAIDYAKAGNKGDVKSFPDGLTVDNAYDVSVNTKPYSSLRTDWGQPAGVPQSVRNARRYLSGLIAEQISIKDTLANALRNDQSLAAFATNGRCSLTDEYSKRLRDVLKIASYQVQMNLAVISDAILNCYDDLGVTPTQTAIAKCIKSASKEGLASPDIVPSLAGVPSNIKGYDSVEFPDFTSFEKNEGCVERSKCDDKGFCDYPCKQSNCGGCCSTYGPGGVCLGGSDTNNCGTGGMLCQHCRTAHVCSYGCGLWDRCWRAESCKEDGCYCR